MKTLKELPARHILGLAFDIDGTVTTDGKLSANALSAMTQAASAGLRLTAITGRSAGFARVLLSLLPIETCIAENGAVTLSRAANGTTLRQTVSGDRNWPRQRARLIALIADALPEISLADDFTLREIDVAWDVGEFATVHPDQVSALRQIIVSEGCSVAQSSIHVHASPAPPDKFAAFSEWATSRSLTERSFVFVGDSMNDQTCFTGFSRSVGVRNVLRYALTEWPKYVTTQEEAAGFVELVEYLLQTRNGSP